ncbi:MAG: GIN domain-containing protein [Bacteroidota bacterium]
MKYLKAKSFTILTAMLLAFVFGTTLTAQPKVDPAPDGDAENRRHEPKIEKFDEVNGVRVKLPVQVELRHGDGMWSGIMIEGKQDVIDNVVVNYNDNENMLSIEGDGLKRYFIDQNDLKIVVLVDNLEEIHAEKDAEVTVTEHFPYAKHIQMKLHDHAMLSFRAPVSAKTLSLETYDQSSAFLDGDILETEYAASNRSKIWATDVKSESTKVSASDFSEVNVHADDLLDIKAFDDSVVRYTGWPADRDITFATDGQVRDFNMTDNDHGRDFH